MSHKTLTDEDLPEAPPRNAFRSWVFRVVMMGLYEGMPLEDIAKLINAYGTDRGYSRYQIYRELKRNGMISLKQCRYPKLVMCRRCSQIGVLNFYYDKTNQTPRYYVKHGRIGTWTRTKAAKYRRCYQKPEHYEYLNKQIAFYEERLKDGGKAEALQYKRTKLLKMAAAWKQMKSKGLL